jgi:hypothetical protein
VNNGAGLAGARVEDSVRVQTQRDGQAKPVWAAISDQRSSNVARHLLDELSAHRLGGSIGTYCAACRSRSAIMRT